MTNQPSPYSFWSRVLYRIIWSIIRFFLVVAFRIKVSGRENERMHGRVIYASNHISALDPPVVGASLKRQLMYLAKQELFAIPIFGRIIRALHARPVNRAGYTRGALEVMKAALEKDEGVLVFPEGTRQKDGRLGEGKVGVGMLAVWTGAPVVPVYVSGTANVWKALSGRCRFRVALGRVVEPPDVSDPQERKRAYQTVTDAVMAEIARLKAEVDQKQ